MAKIKHSYSFHRWILSERSSNRGSYCFAVLCGSLSPSAEWIDLFSFSCSSCVNIWQQTSQSQKEYIGWHYLYNICPWQIITSNLVNCVVLCCITIHLKFQICLHNGKSLWKSCSIYGQWEFCHIAFPHMPFQSYFSFCFISSVRTPKCVFISPLFKCILTKFFILVL